LKTIMGQVQAVCEALDNNEMKILDLSASTYSAEELAEILAALAKNRSVNFADLSYIPLGAYGENVCQRLGSCFKRNGFISRVSLSHSNLGTFDLELMCALASNEQIVLVDLQSTGMDSAALRALAVAIMTPRNKIREVNLKENAFDDNGAKMFAEILSKGNKFVSFVMDKSFSGVFANIPKFTVEDAGQSIRIKYDPRDAAALAASPRMKIMKKDAEAAAAPADAVVAAEGNNNDEDVNEEPGWDMLDTEFVLVGSS